MPKTSVLMTVYNRPRNVLEHTFQMLRRNDLRNTEIVVVNDGSTKDYSTIRAYIEQNDMPVRWIDINTVEDVPGTYHIDGYNNPSHAWNVALDAAQGEIMVVVASDCLIPPHTLKKARRCGRCIWMAGVIDIDTGLVYLGKARIAPYGWVMSWRRDVVGEIRQDENYLKGMGFDDNDFTARLALKAGQVEIDHSCTAFHQSHAPIAYSDGHRGHDINERYTHAKWGGIPWLGDESDPLKVEVGQRGNWPSEAKGVCMVLMVSRKKASEVAV